MFRQIQSGEIAPYGLRGSVVELEPHGAETFGWSRSRNIEDSAPAPRLMRSRNFLKVGAGAEKNSFGSTTLLRGLSHYLSPSAFFKNLFR
jgi:hypothetical protein